MEVDDIRLVNAALAVMADRGPGFDLATYCFKEQLEFIENPKRFKAACCSRRAGKTIGCAAHLISVATHYPKTACLYLTLTRLQAKRIIWEPMKEINEQFNLGGVPHETELTMRFPNGSIIYLSGAKDKEEVKKYLGYPLRLVYIDESQSFRSYLKELVDDVLAPTLFDWSGTLCLIGTPGPVPVGYFYEITKLSTWANHAWTMLQNPFLKLKSGREPMELILEECERRAISLEDPSIQRQCFGKWVNDSNARVFRWEEANDYGSCSTDSYVVGIDLGYDDADAIAVIGWSDKSPQAFLVEEVVTKKQGITSLAEQISGVISKYNPNSVVMDTGGLGKKIAEELITRYNLPIKPAEKKDKFSHIELVNDALRTKLLMAKSASQFAQDSWLLEWNRDKSSGDKLVVSDAFHSDICDAVLYAFREATSWLHVPEAVKPKIGTEAWAKLEAEKLEEMAIAHMQKQMSTDDQCWADLESAGGWN